MKETLTLLLHFLKQPSEDKFENHSFAMSVKWFILLFVIELPLIFLSFFLQKIPINLGFIDASTHRINQYLRSNSVWEIVLVIIIIIPIIEELILRLPLKIKKYNFLPFIVFGILINGVALTFRIRGEYSWQIAIPIIIAGIISFIVFYNPIYRKLSSTLKKNYTHYFYSVSILFAFLHLLNFEYSRYLLLFSLLLVLPQLIAGIFIGFIRIKIGFGWGCLFHALHNAIFILPFLIASNTNKTVVISNIDEDPYTLEIADGYAFNQENGIIIMDKKASTYKITPDEIMLHGTIKSVISKLHKTKPKLIDFKNPLLAEQNVSLYFKNDSAFDAGSYRSSQHFVLHKLLDSYELQMKHEEQWRLIYKLSVADKNQFEKHVNPSGNISRNGFRSFYGANDTISIESTDSRSFARIIENNYNIDVENEIDQFTAFSIRLPNSSVKQLKKYLDKEYGIKLSETRMKTKILVIEKK